MAIEALLAREIPAGVHPAPHDPRLINRWLEEVHTLAQVLKRIDHLA
jgi:saccharopine dehydrogenase (NADP+, L-glutamate forming)